MRARDHRPFVAVDRRTACIFNQLSHDRARDALPTTLLAPCWQRGVLPVPFTFKNVFVEAIRGQFPHAEWRRSQSLACDLRRMTIDQKTLCGRRYGVVFGDKVERWAGRVYTKR